MQVLKYTNETGKAELLQLETSDETMLKVKHKEIVVDPNERVSIDVKFKPVQTPQTATLTLRLSSGSTLRRLYEFEVIYSP